MCLLQLDSSNKFFALLVPFFSLGQVGASVQVPFLSCSAALSLEIASTGSKRNVFLVSLLDSLVGGKTIGSPMLIGGHRVLCDNK